MAKAVNAGLKLDEGAKIADTNDLAGEYRADRILFFNVIPGARTCRELL